MIRFVFLSLLILLVFNSCEKDINIKLDKTNTDIVVDASIENSLFPVVVLSRSLEYFGKISPAILEASYVHHAVITISNGTLTGTLKEDSLRDSVGIVEYFYTFHSSDGTLNFHGEFNTKYSLTIQTDSQTYTATTTIPGLNKKMDSLWWTAAPDPSDSTLVNVFASITDPPGLGNYTRYYTSVNDGPYYPGLNSVYDDQITDGTTYSISIPQGVNRNLPINSTEYGFFHRGDVVTVKLANIDKTTYDFWRTMEYNYSSVGNPFSSPTIVLGNISNGALGYFGGYAAQYKSINIPN